MTAQQKKPQAPRCDVPPSRITGSHRPATDFLGDVNQAAAALHGIGEALTDHVQDMDDIVKDGLYAAVRLIGDHLDYLAAEMNPVSEPELAPVASDEK